MLFIVFLHLNNPFLRRKKNTSATELVYRVSAIYIRSSLCFDSRQQFGRREEECKEGGGGDGTVVGVVAYSIFDAGQRRAAAGRGADQAAVQGSHCRSRPRPPPPHRQDP